MNIERAIEIKERHLRDNQPYDLEELEEADKLSIEALKCIKVLRIIPDKRLNLKLPGETKD